MMNKRKSHSTKFKAKVALEAVKGLKMSSELAPEYQDNPDPDQTIVTSA